MRKLTLNFSYEELIHSDMAARRGWDNSPNDETIDLNLSRLATLLQKIRDYLGKPIMINSGYRSKQLNDAVGSKDSSQHRRGCAADIRSPGITAKELMVHIVRNGFGYDQCILEFDSWVHISVPEGDKPLRGNALVINKQGVKQFKFA